MEQTILVLTTMPEPEAASVLARELVDKRLVACVNCLPAVQSIYRWQGAIEQAQETLLIMKTTQSRYVELESAIRALHPYQVPEIIASPVSAGLPAYLHWIAQETRKDVDV